MNLVLVLHKYSVRLDDPCCFPLGFMTISAVLKDQGHEVKVLNYNLRDYDLVSEIDGCDAVLFTGYEEFLPFIIRDAAICRDMGIQTILGGALATFKPLEMLRHVDTVVTGEGEEVIAQALQSFGVVRGGKPRLDALPLPDYEGFGVAEYHSRNGVKHIGVLTSRGCPYSCKFCAQTCGYQCKSVALVLTEIDYLVDEYSPDLVVFNDNTLNVNKSRFMAICEGMGKRRLPWTAAIRVDVFDEEMAATAKESGCRYLVVGVESFIQKKLDEMNKQITVSQICATLDLLHQYGIGYHGNVLTGLPGETAVDIEREVASIPAKYNIFPVLVQPFIGTIYRGRSITAETARAFSARFKEFIYQRGMNQYAEVI